MKHLVVIAGARPNFMKIAPLCRAFENRAIQVCLVDTGQHYDKNMSQVFFDELGIPKPTVQLRVGPGERIVQTHKIVQGLFSVFAEHPTDGVLVVGDVTSTVAGAMAAVAKGIPLIHVEAGLRSYNWKMPEELNRVVVDHYASHLFVTEHAGAHHLREEAIQEDRIHLVGNVMIDTLRYVESRINTDEILASFGVASRAYGLLTLHRPETVDQPDRLQDVWNTVCEIANDLPLIFPIHPRTKKTVDALGLLPTKGLRLIEPVGYKEMLSLTKHARFVMTDSGGLQEETTALGVPCITLREETERPVTVELGTSELTGCDGERIRDAVQRVLSGEWKSGTIPDLWDGHAAERIADILSGL